jgi:hypothetical protein
MRLALALGCADVDSMLAGLSAEQFAEWGAFFNLEPWGYREERSRVALIAQTVANVSGKVVRSPMDLDDFMPRHREDPDADVVVEKLKATFGYGKGRA